MHPGTSVCVSGCVCVRPVRVLTSESLDLETLLLIPWYIFRTLRSSSYINVIGSRSRSQQQSVCLSWSSSNFWTLWPANFILECRHVFKTSRSRCIKVMGSSQGHASITKYTHLGVVCLWQEGNLLKIIDWWLSYNTSNVTCRRRGPKRQWTFVSWHMASPGECYYNSVLCYDIVFILLSLLFIIKCGIACILCVMRIFEVRASFWW